MSQTESTADPKRRYLCRHIFTNGHRCGSPSLRDGRDYCYYHRSARQQYSIHGRPTTFTMPLIGDRGAIQNAIYEILNRATCGDIEFRHAAAVLYGLQLASSNLNRIETAPPINEPLVERTEMDPLGGYYAPMAEYVEPATKPATEPAASEPALSEESHTDAVLHPQKPVILSEEPRTNAPPPQTSVILSEEPRDESKDPDTLHPATAAHAIPTTQSALSEASTPDAGSPPPAGAPHPASEMWDSAAALPAATPPHPSKSTRSAPPPAEIPPILQKLIRDAQQAGILRKDPEPISLHACAPPSNPNRTTRDKINTHDPHPRMAS